MSWEKNFVNQSFQPSIPGLSYCQIVNVGNDFYEQYIFEQFRFQLRLTDQLDFITQVSLIPYTCANSCFLYRNSSRLNTVSVRNIMINFAINDYCRDQSFYYLIYKYTQGSQFIQLLGAGSDFALQHELQGYQFQDFCLKYFNIQLEQNPDFFVSGLQVQTQYSIPSQVNILDQGCFDCYSCRQFYIDKEVTLYSGDGIVLFIAHSKPFQLIRGAAVEVFYRMTSVPYIQYTAQFETKIN